MTVQCTAGPVAVVGGRTVPVVQPAAGLSNTIAAQVTGDARNKTVTFVVAGSMDSITLSIGEIACAAGFELIPGAFGDQTLANLTWEKLSTAVTGNPQSANAMKTSNDNVPNPVNAQHILFQNQYRLYTTQSRGGHLGDMRILVTRGVYDKIQAHFRPAVPSTPPQPTIAITGTLKHGETHDITIQGTNTHFDNDTRVTIDPASGINIISTARNDQQLVVRIRVAQSADSGLRTLRVVTGEESLLGSVVVERGTAASQRAAGSSAPRPPGPAAAADPCARFFKNVALLQACRTRNPQ